MAWPVSGGSHQEIVPRGVEGDPAARVVLPNQLIFAVRQIMEATNGQPLYQVKTCIAHRVNPRS